MVRVCRVTGRPDDGAKKTAPGIGRGCFDEDDFFSDQETITLRAVTHPSARMARQRARAVTRILCGLSTGEVGGMKTRSGANGKREVRSCDGRNSKRSGERQRPVMGNEVAGAPRYAFSISCGRPGSPNCVQAIEWAP